MKYTQFFTTAHRPDGKSFITLTDDAPENLQEFVRSVHFDYFDGCLPNDWIYKVIDLAFDDLDEESLDNITLEADCYYNDLQKWLDNPFAGDYCTEYMQETCEKMADCTFWDLVGCGQWLAKDRIYRAVDQWISEQVEIE